MDPHNGLRENMIKILHCDPVLDMGGIETMIMRLYRNIDRKEFSFDFLTCGGDQKYYYEDEIRSLGGKIFRVPKRRVSFLRHHTEMMRIIRNSDYDVIHFHSTHPLFTALEVMTVRLAGARNIVVHSHNTSDSRIRKENFLLKLSRKYLMTVPVRLSCSKAAARWLYGTDRKVDIFPLPVNCGDFLFDDSERRALREETGLSDAVIVAHTGRFSMQKNHGFLLQVLKAAIEKDSRVYAFLMGEGPLREEVEKQAEELGIREHVIFWGNVPDVYRKLNAADLFLLPSLFEGLPTVVLEAQAAGLPCLVSDGVTEEIRETELVRMKPLSDGPEDWAETLLGMVKETRGERIVYNGMIAEKYDIPNVTRQLEGIYRSLKKKKDSRKRF